MLTKLNFIKSKILMFLLKIYYTLVGFLLVKKIKRNGMVFVKRNENFLKTIKPNEKNFFKINYQYLEKTYGVTYFNEKSEKIKYWVIGILFKNNEIKMEKYK